VNIEAYAIENAAPENAGLKMKVLHFQRPRSVPINIISTAKA